MNQPNQKMHQQHSSFGFGVVIGIILTFIGQLFLQVQLFDFNERSALSIEYPKTFERLAQCHQNLFMRTYELADYYDSEPRESIDSIRVEALRNNLINTISQCNLFIQSADILLNNVGINEGVTLNKMSDGLADIKFRIENIVQDTSRNETNCNLAMQIPLMVFSDTWKASLDEISRVVKSRCDDTRIITIVGRMLRLS